MTKAYGRGDRRGMIGKTLHFAESVCLMGESSVNPLYQVKRS